MKLTEVQPSSVGANELKRFLRQCFFRLNKSSCDECLNGAEWGFPRTPRYREKCFGIVFRGFQDGSLNRVSDGIVDDLLGRPLERHCIPWKFIDDLRGPTVVVPFHNVDEPTPHFPHKRRWCSGRDFG